MPRHLHASSVFPRMNTRTLIVALILLSCHSRALGFAGTSTIATPGQPFNEQLATKEYVWPEGVLDLINDDRRTVGWWFWFSGCPNDVMHFAFSLKAADDLPRLLDKFQAMKAQHMRVVLVPASAGTARVKTDTPVAAVLELGSQAIMNQWYVGLREDVVDGKKVRVFGATQYEAVPTSTPPSLTIYVEHPHIDLQSLDLKAEVDLVAQVTKDEREQRGKDDKTLRAIDQAVADHAAKQKKAAAEKPKERE